MGGWSDGVVGVAADSLRRSMCTCQSAETHSLTPTVRANTNSSTRLDPFTRGVSPNVVSTLCVRDWYEPTLIASRHSHIQSGSRRETVTSGKLTDTEIDRCKEYKYTTTTQIGVCVCARALDVCWSPHPWAVAVAVSAIPLIFPTIRSLSWPVTEFTLASDSITVTPCAMSDHTLARSLVRQLQLSDASKKSATPTTTTTTTTNTAQLTPTEQDSVHHSLYQHQHQPHNNAPNTDSNVTSSPSSVGPSAAASATAATALFTPSSSVTRICLSVRANDLLSSAWFSEATTLVALFAIDETVSGGANSHASHKYQLLHQTEFVRESNAPVFKTQFVLDRSGRQHRTKSYMLRVYDVESELIDESAYMGLAIFNLEELLQNCRQPPHGGNFVSVVLPLMNPTNAAWNEQLVTAHSTITLSLQIPVEPVGSPLAPISQATHSYTRLMNYLAPNILATNMDLTVTSGGGVPSANLLSVWYRTRSTGLFQLLGTMPLHDPSHVTSHSHTLILSNEKFLEESSAATLQDDVEMGFEVKFVLHDRTQVNGTALATARMVERTLGASVNRAFNTNATELVEARPSHYIGTVTTTFKKLLLALDESEGLILPVTDSASDDGYIKVSLRTRPPPSEVAIVDDEKLAPINEPMNLPTLASTIPPGVLEKAHELIKAGMYFTQYALNPTAPDTVDRRAIRLRLIDGTVEGLGQPTRLAWREVTSLDAAAAAANDSSVEEATMPLADLVHIYGGRESSAIFAIVDSNQPTSLPTNDVLFTLVSSSSTLSLESTSWQTRDTFIFSVLSFQLAAHLPIAFWHPNGVELGVKPQIVANEKTPTPTVVKPTLGGSHGSLKTKVVQSQAATPTTTAAAAVAPVTPASPSSPLSSSSSSPPVSPAKSANSSVTAATSPSSSTSISTPTAASTPASSNEVDLSEVLQKLEKLFEQGRNFLRFTAGGYKPCHISLFLRKDTRPMNGASKPLFSLHWCRADERTVAPTRTIRCDEIIGIALGKQAFVFTKPEAQLAPSAHCFSIITDKRSLHLQSWNERDSDTWSFGIASLIKQYGPRPKLWQVGQYNFETSARMEIENRSELQEEPDGTTQVDANDIPTLANAQGYKCAVELSIKCKNLPSKHNNHIVCVFDRDEQTEKLTYLAQTEKQT